MRNRGTLSGYTARLATVSAALLWSACAAQSVFAQHTSQSISQSADHAARTVADYDAMVNAYCVDCHNLEDFSGGANAATKIET